MASTGPAVYPGASTFPGTGVFPGQGDLPLLLVQYATDDVSVTSPTWLDATSKVRQFSTTRGRESELDDMQAGTASLVLDNRTRTFDPVSNAAIKPLNRWWIREQFTGETQDLFVGYAEAYEQSWPAMVNDAVTTVSCSDEFKVLSLGALPTMSPPVSSYSEVVMNDNPNGYWHMSNASADLLETAAVGDNLVSVSGGLFSSQNNAAIIGVNPDPYSYGGLVAAGELLSTKGLTQGGSADLSSCTGFAIEFWFQTSGTSATQDDMLTGPSVTGPHVQWAINIQNAVISFGAWNGAANITTTAAGNPLTANTWYHIAAVADGSNLILYFNGTAVSVIGGWTSIPTGFVASEFTMGEFSLALTQLYEEVAIYRHTLTASQVLNHYTAGALRGAARLQTADQRMNQVLDTVGSHAVRSIRTGTRTMTGVFFTGQPPLTELTNARDAENVDAMFYTSRSGVLTFLDAAHRASSPWNTVQSTWGDSGGTSELPYQDLRVDFSEQFLANEWNVTADGGLVQTASDATSIAKYYKRAQQLGVPVSSDSQAGTIASALLAKYKDPFTRITGITALASTPAVSEALFRRDLGDCIRILRTPPGGGSRVDQTSFIQKIAMNGSPASPWSVTWTVSPL